MSIGSSSRNQTSWPGQVAADVLVMIITVFLKLVTWPTASVNRPASNSCRNKSKIFGWAFSISSNRITEKGCCCTRETRLPRRIGDWS